MSKQFWAILIGVSIGLILLVSSNKTDDTSAPSTVNEDPLSVQLADHVYSAGVKQVVAGEGDTNVIENDTAKVSIIEYGDFACPSCYRIFPFITQAKAEYGADINYIFRHFPLSNLHPNATAAHRAAEAAGNQGKFFEMHDLLFQRRQEWTAQDSGLDVAAATRVFEGYAADLGLDVDKFKLDAQSNEVFDVIDSMSDGGASIGVTGTPSLYIGGLPVGTPGSYQELKEAIDAEIAKTDTSESTETTEPAE